MKHFAASAVAAVLTMLALSWVVMMLMGAWHVAREGVPAISYAEATLLVTIGRLVAMPLVPERD